MVAGDRPKHGLSARVLPAAQALHAPHRRHGPTTQQLRCQTPTCLGCCLPAPPPRPHPHGPPQPGRVYFKCCDPLRAPAERTWCAPGSHGTHNPSGQPSPSLLWSCSLTLQFEAGPQHLPSPKEDSALADTVFTLG